jgi:hypothetical protein
MKRSIATAAALFTILACLASPALPAEIERVGDGFHPRAKVGPDGAIHVVASGRGTVYYYRSEGSSWTGGPIDGTSQAGTSKTNQPSLGISPDGTLHIVYGPTANMPEDAGDPTRGVFYTTSSGSGWSPPLNIIDLYTEYLAVEAEGSGMLHLVALVVVEPAHEPADRTRYGGAVWFTRETDSWTGPTQLRNPEAKYAMLARDGGGALHLVMRWKYVHYSMYSGGRWHDLPDRGGTFDDILLPGATFSMSAPHVTVTPDGTVHAVAAACHEVSPGVWQWEHARYAFNDGTGWSEERPGEKDGEMVMEGDINLCSSAVEPSGIVHVFCSEAPGRLVHASGRPGSWSAGEVLDEAMAGTVDMPPFDAFYHEGLIHAVYQGSDGVFHLTLEPESPPADEPAAEPAPEEPLEPAPEPAGEEHADIADMAEPVDGSSDPDGWDEGTLASTGGCGCVMTPGAIPGK